MKVDRLFIIEILTGNADQISDSVTNLMRRYQNAVRCTVTAAQVPGASNWQKVICADNNLADARNIILALDDVENVGIYVAAHGGGGYVGGLTAANLAELLKTLGFKKIRKLCLVACHSASGPLGKADAFDQSFAAKLCNELGPSLTPMIAGWAAFINTATEKYEVKIYDENNKPLTKLQKQTLYDKGKKFTNDPRTYSVVTQDARERVKIVFQWQDGAVKRVSLADWTDKGK